MSTKKLSIITVCLFIISLGVYYNENYRSTSLVSGSYFIKGLDLGKIQKISLNFEKDKSITFSRDQGQFTLNSHKSYPADTSKVNDLIYQIASIRIKDKVTSKATLTELQKYGLTSDTKKYQIEIYDTENKKTQSFMIGKKLKNKGHYLLKDGSKEVYLSDGSLWIDSSYKDFISRVLIDVEKDSVEKVLVSAGESLEIERKEKEFNLINPNKEANKEKIDSYVSGLKNTRFDDFFTQDEPKVKEVSFDKSVKIRLKNKLTYDLRLGEKNGEYFVKASALANDVPNKVVISQGADKKELEGVGDMIQARQKADQFNIEKGSWVYRIDKSNYQKLVKKSSEFM